MPTVQASLTTITSLLIDDIFLPHQVLLCVLRTKLKLKYIFKYLHIDSFNHTRQNMKNMHFGVTLCYFLKQLKEQCKHGLQVLKEK